MRIFKNCPVFPVVSTSLTDAAGGKPTKLQKQMLIKLKIAELEQRVILLVIPK